MNTLLETDKKAFLWLQRFVGKNEVVDMFWKITGVYLVYAIPVFLVVIWFADAKSRATGIRAAIVGVIGWKILAPLISKLWFRERPFTAADLGTKELIFHRPDYSFPSDHAMFAFAVASAFYFAGYKELGIGLYIVAFFIALGRVSAGFHYPGDVIAGAIIGILLSWLAWTFRAKIDPIIVEPFLKLAKFIRVG